MQGVDKSNVFARLLDTEAVRRKEKAGLSGRQDAVWACARRHRCVANGAGIQGTGMSLQGDELDGVSGLGAARDGVCAIMAGFAIDATVSRRKPIESVILLEAIIGVAAIAARLIEPGIGVLGDLGQSAVAVNACHSPL